MKSFLTLGLLVASLFAHSQTKDQPDGEIKGTVADQDGSPVAAATVYAIPQGLSFDGITPRSVKTDRNGKFDLRGALPLGEYKVYSRKDEDSYPDRSSNFFADSKIKWPTVDLTQDHPSATIKVKLGEKAAVLVGRVIDADTGAALPAKLVFLDENGNDHSLLATGNYRTLLPPGKDVTMMVMVLSPEYHAQPPGSALHLAPGQEMHMDIPVSKK